MFLFDKMKAFLSPILFGLLFVFIVFFLSPEGDVRLVELFISFWLGYLVQLLNMFGLFKELQRHYVKK